MPGVPGRPHPHRGHAQSPETRARIAATLRARHAGSGGSGAPGGHGGGGHGGRGGGHGTPASRPARPNADTRRRVANAQRELDAMSPSARKAAKKEHQKNLAKAHAKDIATAFQKGWAHGMGKGHGPVDAAVQQVKKQAKRKFPKPPTTPSHR